MALTRSGSRRFVRIGALAFSAAILAAACGGTASPTAGPSASPAASVAASSSPSPTPSPSPSPIPSPSPSPSVAASAPAPAVAEDPAKGLKIAAPYTLVELDPALTQYFRNTMTKTMGGFGNLFSIGLRQVGGGTAQQNILIVMGFPTGMLDDVYYKAAVGGMTAAMDATDLKKTTLSGLEVSSAKIATGTLATFHIGDHLIMIISAGTEALPVAKAVVAANK